MDSGDDLSTLQSQVAQLDKTIQAGFGNVAGGLGVLIQLATKGNELAAANNEQNATVICWLDKIAHLLCDIKRDLDASLTVHRQIEGRVRHISELYSFEHAQANLQVDTINRLQAQIERCCTPTPPPPPPCFEECPSPEQPPYEPVSIDWKPVSFD